MSADRTAEIWSTRLQRELLALTAPEGATDEKDKESSSSTADVALLPPFVQVIDHSLDIIKATCDVTFQIEISDPSGNNNKEKTKGQSKEPADETSEEQKAQDTNESGTDTTDAPNEKFEAVEKESPEKESDEQDPAQESTSCVLVTLDASMKHNSKGEIINSANTYPFQKPKATLKSGAKYFPKGSDIRDGDEIEVSCDWTPSLHLSDAALNVSLTIRESILRGEPYHKVKPKVTKEDNTIDALLRKFSLSSSSKASKPKKNNAPKPKPRRTANEVLQIGDIIELNEPPYNMCAGMYSCKAIRRPQFMETEIEKYEASKAKRHAVEEEEEDENATAQGLGNYMKLQAGGIRKVAGSGISGTRSMFKSFISSAKSAMEDSFLMITDSYIVELRSSKFNIGSAAVTYAISVSLLAKLKFRRQESISLFFKEAPDDPLILMCPDSADAVQQIQTVLKRHGVKGKHTNAATQRAIQSALNLVVEIQAREKGLDDEPTVENVDRIMSLYRQAAERFESAGDVRHEEVMNHMRKFLKKPRTVSILDGSYRSDADNASIPAPQGVILEPTPAQLQNDSDDELENRLEQEHDADAMNAANERADSFDMEDDLDNFLANEDTPVKKSNDDGDEDDHDPVAELDAMFSAADKELSDILNS